MAKDPTKLYRKVVKGMLPKNRLGEAIIGNMYVIRRQQSTNKKHKARKLLI